MSQKKESFFWTSYSDLMTSLFFVMLVLFVLVIVMQHQHLKRTQQLKELTEQKLQKIQNIENSTKDLDKKYFTYRPDYKKYVLNINGEFDDRDDNIHKIKGTNRAQLLNELTKAGREIESFLQKHHDNQYIMIVEGQASRDKYLDNYGLSYRRALALIRYWIDEQHINFGNNCEILISGSGDGKLPTHSMRDPVNKKNQRFLIHILPKNILGDDE